MKKLSMILSLVFVGVMFSAMIVMASENNTENRTDVEKVFPKEEVQKLIADIEKKRFYLIKKPVQFYLQGDSVHIQKERASF